MKECISEGEGEIDWDGEMMEWIKRCRGERKGEWNGMKCFFLLGRSKYLALYIHLLWSKLFLYFSHLCLNHLHVKGHYSCKCGHIAPPKSGKIRNTISKTQGSQSKVGKKVNVFHIKLLSQFTDQLHHYFIKIMMELF